MTPSSSMINSAPFQCMWPSVAFGCSHSALTGWIHWFWLDHVCASCVGAGNSTSSQKSSCRGPNRIFLLAFSSPSSNRWLVGSVCFLSAATESVSHSPARMQATFRSHHSGTRGRIATILSPLCKPQASERTLAAFLDREPNSSKLHFTSSPLSLTHQKAGFAGFLPAFNT